MGEGNVSAVIAGVSRSLDVRKFKDFGIFNYSQGCFVETKPRAFLSLTPGRGTIGKYSYLCDYASSG